MKANVGGLDKVIRIGIGIALLTAVFWLEGPLRWWGLVGIIPLLTGVFGYCPLYAPLGLSTCPIERNRA
jgi:hypothetical protein